MSDKDVMQGWIIDDANHFIQSFKQLTYIQDRKSYLENRSDSFYYLDLLNNFQSEIGRLRSVLLQSYSCLKQMYAKYDGLYVWRRVIQRLKDIMEVSKIVFPFEISDDLFSEDKLIQDVVNFLGKSEADGQDEELDDESNANIPLDKYGSAQQFNKQNNQNESQSGTGVVVELFKDSNRKYIETIKYLDSLCSDVMEIEETQFNFNFHKPLSINLDNLYLQMLGRNDSIQKTIHDYLKSKQAIQIIRKSEIIKDLAHLSSLQARLFNQQIINVPPKSQFETLTVPKNRQYERSSSKFFQKSQKLLSSQQTSRMGSIRVSVNSGSRSFMRKSRDSELPIQFGNENLKIYRTSKLSKNLETAPVVRTSEFCPSAENTRKSYQIHSRQSVVRPQRISRAKQQLEVSPTQKHLTSTLSNKFLTPSNSSKDLKGGGNLQLGIAVRKYKNLHLLNYQDVVPYKQFIKTRGLQIIRNSTCF